MFINKFKNVNFEGNCVLVDFEPADQLHKLFLFRKVAEHFPLMVCNRYNTFPFRTNISSYSLMILAASPYLSTFLALSFSSSVSIVSLLMSESISSCSTSSLLSCLIFLISFSPLKTKNNQYTINLKHPLQTKMQLCWAQNTSILISLKVVKVLYHKHFFKTVFQIKLISKKKKKILKSSC